MASKQYNPYYANSHALIIGIDAYAAFPALSTATKGAESLADLLVSELDFPADNIITLLNEEASQRNIRRKLTDPFSRLNKVGPDDRVLIYIAAHGVTLDTAVGEVGYIVPADAEPAYEDTLLAMDELTHTAAERIHAKHVLFLIDACFSGFATMRGDARARQIETYLSNPTRQVITAGTRDQAVSDMWGPDGHALFTGFLLQGLRGAAPMPGGILRAFHLAGYLQDQVAQHSRSHQTPQYAQLMGSQGGDFVLAIRPVEELPQRLLSLANSHDPTQRLIVVSELREFCEDVDNAKQAATALAAIQDLANDDRDLMVRSAARAALRDLMPVTNVTKLEREKPIVAVPPVAFYEMDASEDDTQVGPRRRVTPEIFEPVPPTPVSQPDPKVKTRPNRPTMPVPPVQRSALSTPLWVLVGSLVIIAAAVGGLIWGDVLDVRRVLAQTESPAATPTLAILDLAEQGVSANEEWTPVVADMDGVPMALVPVGCLDRGAQGEICLEEPFWIDVNEVTNKQYGDFGRYSGDQVPRDSVTWSEAEAHCEARSARLPTDAEWDYVARGPDGLRYPWGDTFVPAYVVFSETAGGSSAEVGSRPFGASWVGVVDLSGNLREWVADADGDLRVVRGGSWALAAFAQATTYRTTLDPDSSMIDLGFRCARDY
ncbi:MAG: SUMF1/EgtB/PvdO family nonheme iron enzyme [Chloroflexi bacterium]|nr:SUMF1/EgtB/PvdO family nonheme iron enzyme [Chloroflexota bacterium]